MLREQLVVLREQLVVLREQLIVLREQLVVLQEQVIVLQERIIVLREQIIVGRGANNMPGEILLLFANDLVDCCGNHAKKSWGNPGFLDGT